MMETKLKIAIEKGRVLFGKIKDAFHSLDHARRVEKIGLEILKNQTEVKVSPLFVSAAAYWHDIYKMKNKFSLKIWVDGRKSSLLIVDELKKILPPESLEVLQKAAEKHSQLIKYAFFPHSFSPFERILIEADAIDFLSSERWQEGVHRQNMTYFQKLLFSLYGLTSVFLFSLLSSFFFTFPKSRQIFKREVKNFWNFFLFRDRYFLKVLANRV